MTLVANVTYTLSDLYATGIRGATVRYGPSAQMYDILAQLVSGGGDARGVGGQFTVNDSDLVTVLDKHPAVKRTGTTGPPPGPAQPIQGPLIGNLLSPALGDTLFIGGDGQAHNLPAGSSGQVLTTNGPGGAPSWQPGGSSSPFAALYRLDIRNYGAKFDGIPVVDATIVAGQLNKVQSAQAGFSQARDAGKVILINGAGVGGDPLSTIITSVSGGVATLATPATAPVTNQIACFGTDDTAAWLLFFDALVTTFKGWTGILPFGISIINGPYLAAAQTVVGSPTGLIYRAQLPFPAVDGNIIDPIMLRIVGAAPLDHTIEATFSGTGLSSADIIRQPGSYVLSTRVDGTWDAALGWAAMFAGPDLQMSQAAPALPQTAGFSNLHVRIENLGILTPDNPTLVALNMQMLASGRVFDSHIECTAQKEALTWPTHPSGQGLIMPSVDNFNHCSIDRVTIRGQYCAAKPGEHTRIGEMTLFSNLCAIGAQTGIYPWTAGTIQTEAQNYVLADASPNVGVQANGKACPLEIQMLQMEDGSGAKAPVYHFWDNGGFKGTVNYWRKLGDVITNGSLAHLAHRNTLNTIGGPVVTPTAIPYGIYFRAAGSSAVGSIAAGTTAEFFANTGIRKKVDLTNKTSVSLETNITTVAAGTTLVLQYTTDLTGATGWTAIDGASGPAVSLAATGVVVVSASIAAGAKGVVLLRLVVINSSGVAVNPALGLTVAEFT